MVRWSYGRGNGIIVNLSYHFGIYDWVIVGQKPSFITENFLIEFERRQLYNKLINKFIPKIGEASQ